MAATVARQTAAVRAFVEAGADVDIRDDRLDNPFLYAGAEGLLDILRLSSLGVTIASLMGIILSLILAIAGRTRLRILGILGYILAAGIGGLALALAQSVSILSLGIH